MKVNFILSSAFMTVMIATSFGGSVSKELATSNDVTIGNQVWMTENLNVDYFRNGDSIPQAQTNEEWEKAGLNKQPAWCYFDNEPANGEKYGKLYNWYAVSDPRGLAPIGWHIPSDEDWKTLTDYLGGEDDAGAKLKGSSGFLAVLGGFRYDGGSFYNFGLGGWWSSTEDNTEDAWYRDLNYNNDYLTRSKSYKSIGYSVRCLKD